MRILRKRVVGVFIFCGVFCGSLSHAEPFVVHTKNIGKIEEQMKTLDKELEKKVASKKNTRDQARVEETLQRIVEIHGELISLRKDLDMEMTHVRKEHYAEGKAINLFADVKQKLSIARRKKSSSPLQIKLNNLFQKVQSKYATFVVDHHGDEALERVERVVKTQKGKRRSKEAEVYLRKKSDVKLKK